MTGTLTLDDGIEELQLTVRAYNALLNDNIRTIGELTQTTAAQLMRIPNFGKISLADIRGALAEHGLFLRDEPKIKLHSKVPQSRRTEQERDMSVQSMLREVGNTFTWQQGEIRKLQKALIDALVVFDVGTETDYYAMHLEVIERAYVDEKRRRG